MDIMTWEYKNVDISDKELNELGKQGWEMCGAVSTYVYLKRPSGILHVNEVAKERPANTVER